jgi:hypothetical protein
MSTRRITSLLAFLCWSGPLPLYAFELPVPQVVPIYGHLEDAAGQPVNGSVTMRFSIYEGASGGTAQSATSMNVLVSDGVFYALVGSADSAMGSMGPTRQMFVGVSVNNGTELTPRFQVGTVPYVFNAMATSMFGGMSPSAFSYASHGHSWSAIDDIPAPIADGDQGLSASEVDIAVRAATYDSNTELHGQVDDRYVPSDASIPWAGLFSVPAGIADDVDDTGVLGQGLADSIPVFNANNELENSTLIQRQGNVETSGDLEVAGQFRYQAARTHTITLGAASFRPGSYGSEIYPEPYSLPYPDNDGDVVRAAGRLPGMIGLAAPMSVPAGGQITDLACYFFDNSTTLQMSQITVGIYGQDAAVYGYGMSIPLASAYRASTPTDASTLPIVLNVISAGTPISVTVDSSRQFFLGINWYQEAWDWYLYFSGCSLKYELQSVP